MIPKRLTLINFLSYREVTLDFAGLHVACICGPNGAGKSSLLEAMAWVLWGQSRVAVDDDVIHLGAKEVRVEFIFEHQGQVYRVLRGRKRKQGCVLEFQIQTPEGFRSLTRRGVRATQQLILRHLKVDYETFVHSAYLRQGRADEFMLKRPGERKQILADLLKLNQYDRLSEQARERGRDYQAEMKALTATLAQAEEQLAQRSATSTQYQTLQHQAGATQQTQQTAQQQRHQLQQQQQQRQQQLQQLQSQRQQLNYLNQSQHQRRLELQRLQHQCNSLQAELDAAPAITTSYAQLQQLQQLEKDYAQRFQQYQQLQTRQVQLQGQDQETRGALQTAISQVQLKLASLNDTIADLNQRLSQRETVTASLKQLQVARRQLQTLDQRQVEVTPLQQRRQQVHMRLKQTSARLEARLEAISQTQATLTSQQRPELQQTLEQLQYQLTYLEQRRAYQTQVRQKGQERRDFMAQLQTEQRQHEQQIIQLEQRLDLLAQPEAHCPLCERPLADHGPQVIDQLKQERDTLQQRIWVIREQLTTSEREIQVLRREYRELELELENYGAVLQEQGALKAQLTSATEITTQLEALAQERHHLEQCLDAEDYGADLQQEYRRLGQQLLALNYDERDHALVRNQVEKLRWAEFKQAELAQAEQRLARLLAERPGLEQELEDLRSQLQHAEQHPTPDLLQVETALAALDYSPEHHQQLRTQLQTLQPWQLRYQTLQQAQATLPELEQQRDTLVAAQTQQQQDYDRLQQHITETEAAIVPDVTAAIQQLEATLTQLQTQREQQISQLGHLDQQLQQLDRLQQQVDQQRQQLHSYQHQLKVHQELQLAFGKNGIQALMIENLLPQLEAETNQILGRLSAHQLHVQFVTQRSGRKKLIDTLDILIADTQGTRAYETYSGGEAFRVNFAIRLALARLLAQRSGMALQMLIIDEGFGTQDQAGCDRLVAAINAIAPDFACILAVTHMPHFREAFQTRIDVTKTETGSQVRLSG
ncbi:exonuclease [Leptolyngbya sp. Heron Island J]|uniref:AAA family ATPase n=1 Tax=Leptolyngbya sp. Heron Island J TaxID=1385935 RepID=UPI0003B95C1A|nr:AAA family ATPase [Leptolyngbya sp. Heron Island J]ESA36442.1 exonuclease [Leptolyngbya sp. Heron Island J]